jgi:Ulp1 family protease
VAWLHDQNPNQPGHIVKRIGKIDLKQMHIARLQPLEWLNDELINAYFEVLTNNLLAPPRTAFAFNSFFLDKLQRKGYDRVARWTKNVDIFAYDYTFIPVHVESRDEGDHWCLVSVNVAWRRIDYFDSLYSRAHCIDLDVCFSLYHCRRAHSPVDSHLPMPRIHFAQRLEDETWRVED